MLPARVLVADPPWLFGDPLPGKGRGASKQYSCLPYTRIARIPLPPRTGEGWLFLWYVTSMIEEARDVVRAWGYEPTGGELVWVKTTGIGSQVADPEMAKCAPIEPDDSTTKLHFGMGRTVRNCDERCIIARRGRPTVADKGVRSVFFAPVGEHSEKPARFYQLVERLTGSGPYVELFSRHQREGWTCLGDQAGLLSTVAP